MAPEGRRLVAARAADAGVRSHLWSDFSFVASSGYRTKVLMALAARPKLPKQIAEDTSLRIAHVSRSLRELSDRKLAECITPQAHARGRLYAMTTAGSALVTYFQDTNRRFNPAAQGSPFLGFVPKIRAQFLLQMLRAAEREWGKETVQEALRPWGVDSAQLKDDDWLSIDSYNEGLELLEGRFGDGSFQSIRSLGAKAAPNVASIHMEIAKLIPMEALVERAPIVYNKEWNYGRLEVRHAKHRGIFLHYEWFPTPAFCATFHGVYEGILRFRKLAGTVTKTRCVRRGDDHCEYVMEWS